MSKHKEMVSTVATTASAITEPMLCFVHFRIGSANQEANHDTFS